MFTKFNETIHNFHHKKLNGESRESGNTFIYYMLLLPVLFITMSFSMQVSMNQYAKTTLQSALDQATQSALSASNNGGGRISVSSDVVPKIRQVYDANRTSQVYNLLCQNLPEGNSGFYGKKIVSGKSGCQWREGIYQLSFNGTQPVVRYTLTDYTKNLFATAFRSESQSYNLESKASITTTNN